MTELAPKETYAGPVLSMVIGLLLFLRAWSYADGLDVDGQLFTNVEHIEGKGVEVTMSIEKTQQRGAVAALIGMLFFAGGAARAAYKRWAK